MGRILWCSGTRSPVSPSGVVVLEIAFGDASSGLAAGVESRLLVLAEVAVQFELVPHELEVVRVEGRFGGTVEVHDAGETE